MILIRDAMQTEVIWLFRDQSIAEAAAVFSERDISGAPVCDRHGNILGMLSKTDVADCAARSEFERSVEEAMTPEVISVGAEEPLERAISIMAFEGIHRLVVLDERALPVGLITSMDILRELAGYGRKATRRVIAVAPPPASGGASKRFD